MQQHFDPSANAHVTRDANGTVRDLLHVEEPFTSTAGTALLAAREYLDKFGSLLGISAPELANFTLPPETSPTRAGIEYRFGQEKPQFDTTTVVFEQTCFGLPVWEAGVAVHMRQQPFVVLSAQSSRHASVSAEMPSDKALARLHKLDPKQLAKSLGLDQSKDCDPSSLTVLRQRLVIYRYDETRRMPQEDPPQAQAASVGTVQHTPHPSLPLPPLPETIQPGKHYVAAELIFTLAWREIKNLAWRAIVDVETLAVLHLRAFIDNVSGLVFKEDPITSNAGPLPGATGAELNGVRSSQLLADLDPPAGGIYSLTGERVSVIEIVLPAVAPPTEPAGTNFDYNARTNDFAAVNAYYHCDRFFRLVQDLGFDLGTYFTGTVFPSLVDHRGRYGSLDGVEINAYCQGNGMFGIDHTAFMLADVGDVVNPMGLACDWRVVLHELGGHGILYNHVNSANFGFAHSAGDSFAAVLNDPETRAPDRFQTFPWVYGVVARRHDRDVTAGWAWGGAMDFGSYSSEQILCTTHFRIYRSIGGDAGEVAARKYAARHTAYLMLRAIGSLTQPTNPGSAALYASALITADMGNWTSEDLVGSVYWKVIRWAFEKQGLYQPPGAPVPVVSEGAPPEVDVYIDDGRAGEYAFVPNFWETADIWNRHGPDGGLEHQTPRRCEKNHAYVRIKNRGTKPAKRVRVHAYHCRPAAGLVWPDDFEPMTTESLGLPGALAPGDEVVVGPFEWMPVHDDHEGLFMRVSAPADRANSDPATGLPSAVGPTPAWRLVPADNNSALRNMVALPAAGGRCALEAAFCNRVFWAQNPFAKTARIKVQAVMPAFLSTRGWAMRFDNPGGGNFTLGPRASREVRPRLVSGREFSPAELADAGATSIVIRVLADGIVVGGLTYVLDGTLGSPDDAKKCCEPCIDDRCKKPCPCPPPPCEEPEKPECPPDPCDPPKVHCDDDGVRCVRVEIDLEPCPRKPQKGAP